MQGTNVAEDKKTGPAAGKDLTSKIATAYRNQPPEQRAKPSPDSSDIQNPELDQAFDKMVEMYKMKRPERENSVVTFPAPPTLRASRPQAEEGEEYECPECGHDNPAGNQFCGMCGAAREDAVAVPAAEGTQPAEGESLAPTIESGIKHHHHYYHHHHYRNNPYLLLAVVLLLGVIAWQQWREYQRSVAPPVAAPAVKAQPQPPPPAQAQPSPSPKPVSPAAVPPPGNSKPAKKPVSPSPASQAPAQPIRRGEPPGPQARAPETPPPAVIPALQIFPRQPMPALQSFAATPAKPASATQRLQISEGVSAGRLIKKVAPVYPPLAERVQGQVVLQAVIAKDGSVQSVKVVSGNPVLGEAAAEAVRQWRYQPYLLNGEAVEVETQVQVNFKR